MTEQPNAGTADDNLAATLMYGSHKFEVTATTAQWVVDQVRNQLFIAKSAPNNAVTFSGTNNEIHRILPVDGVPLSFTAYRRS